MSTALILAGIGALALPGCGERADRRPAAPDPALTSRDRLQVADCERGPITIGSGPPNWRRRSWRAGPLGVFRHPLRNMTETRNGQLVAKMPVIVEGQRTVRLSVPPAQRRRVFLYYGRMLDRRGRPTTGFSATSGFSVVEFRPCTTKPRTVWPGGIRVGGRAPVRLTVTVEGREPIALPLGRPRPHVPAG